MSADEILLHYGWTVTSQSPRAIVHEDGSIATGTAVDIVETALIERAESEGL